MIGLMRASLTSALLALPIAALAQSDTASQTATNTMMNCQMMAGMGGMQKDLGTMMDDVESMMKSEKDAAQRQKLRKMHGRMAAMMVNMRKMEMMGGMMQPRPPPKENAPSTPDTPSAPVGSPEDHQAHHPAQ